MALRKIIEKGDETLLKKSKVVDVFDKKLHQLLDDMADTMYNEDGCGLAAIQIGVLKNVAVIDVGEGIIELINPQIIESTGIQEKVEGCLSIPGIFGVTSRPKYVKVKAQNRKGKWFEVEGEDLKARALCHEIDHLNGILFEQHIIRESNDEDMDNEEDE